MTCRWSFQLKGERAGLRMGGGAANTGATPCPYGAGAIPYLRLGTGTIDSLRLTCPGRRPHDHRAGRRHPGKPRPRPRDGIRLGGEADHGLRRLDTGSWVLWRRRRRRRPGSWLAGRRRRRGWGGVDVGQEADRYLADTLDQEHGEDAAGGAAAWAMAQ